MCSSKSSILYINFVVTSPLIFFSRFLYIYKLTFINEYMYLFCNNNLCIYKVVRRCWDSNMNDAWTNRWMNYVINSTVNEWQIKVCNECEYIQLVIEYDSKYCLCLWLNWTDFPSFGDSPNLCFNVVIYKAGVLIE